jgi:putative membrane protein insertion efficiency factor
MRVVGAGLMAVYRYTLWPVLGSLSGGVAGERCCKYHPTCSAYAAEAVARYGLLRGSILAGWRLMRCNPWSRGGVDRVDDQRLFRRRPS